MSKPTKIILDKQSDLILTNAQIVGATGIVKSDLPGLVTDLANLDTAIQTEATDRSTAIQAEAAARAAEIAEQRLRIDAILDGADVNLNQFREVVAFVQSIDLANDTDLLAKVAEINGKISAEETARIAGDAKLTADLATLQSYVDTTVNSAITQLTSDLADLQSYVDTTVDSAITSLTADLAVETAARIADVDAEEARALAAEAALQAAIDAEAAARIAADETLDGKIADIISNTNAPIIDSFTEVVDNLNAEITRAEAAEASLEDNKLSRDGSQAMTGSLDMGSNDITNVHNINGGDGDMSINSSGKMTIESTGYGLIEVKSDIDMQGHVVTGLYYATEDGDAANKKYVDDHDAQLQSNLDAAIAQEVSDRTAAIATANVDITNETVARIAGDAYLQSEIDLMPMTDGDTIDVDQVQNVIRLKEVVSAPASGVRTFEGDIKVGAQPDSQESYNELSLITKGVLDKRLFETSGSIEVALQEEIDRAQGKESELESSIETEKARIDAILDASEAEKDSFAEIVQLINSVDTENDQVFAGYVLSNNERLTNEEQERLRITNLLGDGLITEQIAREDGDAVLQHELDVLPTTDGETIEVNPVDNTIRLKEVVEAPRSGYRTFRGDTKADEQPATLPSFNELSLVTKLYVDEKVSVDLTDAINAEEDSRTQADATLQSLLDTEVADRIADVDAEEARATAAEAQLSSDLANLQTYVDVTVNTAIETLTSDLADETSRAEAAEGVLQSNIDEQAAKITAILEGSDVNLDTFKEVVDFVNSIDMTNDDTLLTAVTNINTEIDAEISRAEAAELSMRNEYSELINQEVQDRIADVNTEEARAKAAELSMRNEYSELINQEVQDRIAGDVQLSSDLAAEVSRATAAEGVLQGNIDYEKSRIDAILIGASASADNFAEIVQLINSVDTENDQAFAGYVLSNDAALAAEVLRATGKEDYLEAALSGEINGRVAGDAALAATFSAALSTEATRALAAELVLTNNLSTEEAARIAADVALSATFSAALSAEEVARIAGDAQLSSDLADLQSYVDTTVDSAIATLTSDLANETEARIADVDAEEARAFAAEGVLQTNINTEANERVAEDITLQGNIDIEATRAQAAETAIAADLGTETAARISAVSTEETARIAGDAQLTSDLATEATRALAAEGVLQGNIDYEKSRIDAILIGASASADNFAEIVALINSVDTTNDTAFASYVLSNDAALAAEAARATSAEGVLTSDLSTEAARATAAEAVLTSDLASEAERATAAEATLTAALSAEEVSRIAGDESLQASLNNEIADRIAAGQSAQASLDNETTRAIAAEGVLTSDLSTEVAARIAAVSAEETRALDAESALSATFSAALSAETFRATAAELQLSNDLSDESSYRIDADTLLQSNIDYEKSRIDAILIGASASADNFAEIVALINSVDTTNDQAFAGYVLSNDAALAAEVARAIASESTLSATFSAAMSDEVSRAIAAETVLTSDLSTESAARIAGDAALSATFSAAMTTEVAARIAGDAALSADFANIYSKKVAVTGTPNGVLTTFTLALPVRIGSEMIYVNGLLMEEGEDYTTIITSGKVSGVEFLYAPISEMKVKAYGVCGLPVAPHVGGSGWY